MSKTRLEPSRYTVGVFQDAQWAEKGLDALLRHGFPPASLSLIGADAPPVAELTKSRLGTEGERVEVKGIGRAVAAGPLVGALAGDDDGLTTRGVGATIRRVGFQAHDGHIFETLVARGGVLVAITTEPRAADALALLHAYGGGNAAIGAWTGRV